MTAEVIRMQDREPRSSEGRAPPHDDEAELALLSAAWQSNELIAQVDWLLPEYFCSEPNRRCWEATMHIRGCGQQADSVTVAGWLKDNNRLAQIGWERLEKAVFAAPYAKHITSYATRVFDLWRLREGIAIAQRASAVGYGGVVDTQKYLDDVVRELAKLAWRNTQGRLQGNSEALRSIVVNIQKAQAERAAGMRGTPGLFTSMAAFDRATGGLHPGQKVTIASVLGVGKTAWALQATTHIARSGVGVLWFPEIDKTEMLKRQLASAAQVSFRHVINEALAPDEWDRVIAAMPAIEGLPIMFDERASKTAPTITEIRQTTQRAMERCRAIFRKPLGVVVIDYVQRMAPSSADARAPERVQISHITRALEAMAQEFKLSVVELAQSRIEKNATGKVMRPTKGSIADSREIEKSSHVVVFLHPEAPPKSIGPLFGGARGKSVAQIVAKNRNGPEAIDYLDFHGATQTFFDPTMNAASRAYVDGADQQHEDDDGSISALIQK